MTVVAAVVVVVVVVVVGVVVVYATGILTYVFVESLTISYCLA
jgi:hypothetical protein